MPKQLRNLEITSRRSVHDLERRPQYRLRLYVAGATERASRAILNLKSLCEEHLKGCYKLEVVDIYQQPALAKAEQIIAVPTLVKHLPQPLRRFIGDMSQTKKLLVGLDVQPLPAQTHENKDHTSCGKEVQP